MPAKRANCGDSLDIIFLSKRLILFSRYFRTKIGEFLKKKTF